MNERVKTKERFRTSGRRSNLSKSITSSVVVQKLVVHENIWAGINEDRVHSVCDEILFDKKMPQELNKPANLTSCLIIIIFLFQEPYPPYCSSLNASHICLQTLSMNPHPPPPPPPNALGEVCSSQVICLVRYLILNLHIFPPQWWKGLYFPMIRSQESPEEI